jgi:hypothetical protein
MLAGVVLSGDDVLIELIFLQRNDNDDALLETQTPLFLFLN